MVFNLELMRWDKKVTSDGRKGLFGGALIKTNEKLLYLGGSEQLHRDASRDGPFRQPDDETLLTGMEYRWAHIWFDPWGVLLDNLRGSKPFLTAA